MATAGTGAPFGASSIPPLGASGVLPPYVGSSPTIPTAMSPYATSLVEIVQRFSGSPGRVTLLQGYLNYRRALSAVGLADGFQWLSGSFFEDIENLERRDPHDIDVVTFWKLPPDLPPVFGPVITKLPGFLAPLQKLK